VKARLEDARFFWENDLKISLPERAKQLSEVVFQEKLGSYVIKWRDCRSWLAIFLSGLT
jgi:glycyl-tRNA synthetase beta chain